MRNGLALSRGERVDRDGALTSRRGPGEGSVPRLERIGRASLTAIRERQPVPVQVVGAGLALPSLTWFNPLGRE
jgi:hypothetical protein